MSTHFRSRNWLEKDIANCIKYEILEYGSHTSIVWITIRDSSGSQEKLLRKIDATIICSAKYGYSVLSGVEGMVLHAETLCLSCRIFELFCPLQRPLLSQICFVLSGSVCKSNMTQHLKKMHINALFWMHINAIDMLDKYGANTLCGDVHVFRPRKTLQ